MPNRTQYKKLQYLAWSVVFCWPTSFEVTSSATKLIGQMNRLTDFKLPRNLQCLWWKKRANYPWILNSRMFLKTLKNSTVYMIQDQFSTQCHTAFQDFIGCYRALQAEPIFPLWNLIDAWPNLRCLVERWGVMVMFLNPAASGRW